MRESGRSWSSVKGRLEVREDEAWLNEGRRRYHRESVPGQSEPGPDFRITKYSFQVVRSPLRVRMTLISDEFPGDSQPAADLIVRRDRAWWLRTGDEERSGDGIRRSAGLCGLDVLLSPEPFADLTYGDARTSESGRPSILVSGEAPEIDRSYPNALTVLSASRYELEVDTQVGILLAGRTYIEDRIARETTLHNIETDTAMDDSVFLMPLQPA